MYCNNCGKQNRDKAFYCVQCGKRLVSDAPEAKQGSALSPSASAEEIKPDAQEDLLGCAAPKGQKLRLAIMMLIGIAVGFLLALGLYFLTKGCGAKHDPAASETDALLVNTPKPTLSPKPLDMIKPTPKPTPSPSPIPTPSPKPLDMIKPTPRPTPIPDDTPVPTVTSPAASVEWADDCVPVDALCRYMLNGGADNIRLALPPEYIAFTVQSYGAAGALLGSEDKVLEYAGKLILAGINLKYGKITAIDYRIISRRVMSPAELSSLCSSLPAFGMTVMPTEAHCLTVDITFDSSKGTFTERLEPRVLLIDGSWYLDPEDLDF